MGVTSQNSSRFTFSQRLTLAIVPRIVWALLWVVGRTWRYEEIAEEGVTPILEGERADAVIYCFWHQCVLPCTLYFRHSRAVILISQSFDGELIARVLGLFGYDAIRGSSSRGAREGLYGLKRVMENGRAAIFTADGPRGPIYETKLGPVKLAQITGVPIGCFHFEPEHAWRLNSWDRFLIPKPFTRICVSWASWTHIPANLHAADFETSRIELNQAMERARHNAIEYFRKTAP
jgi:lysophospholipid acyltransferase (LPLAT)-like uncharacterized protein